jgi:hypothetical protein
VNETAPAAIVVPRPRAPKVVRVAISEPAVLRDLLRLDEGTLAGAAVEHGGPGAATLVLYIDHPAVPEGADEMTPQYERDTTAPDPIRLTGVCWFAGGHEITPAG